MQKVQIPFDGMAKTPVEAADIIRPFLLTNQGYTFVIPVQWEWKAVNVYHPVEGLMAILKKDYKVAAKYNFESTLKDSQIFVTARPC